MEYEWYKNGNAITSIRAGITRINATDNTPMDVFGLVLAGAGMVLKQQKICQTMQHKTI